VNVRIGVLALQGAFSAHRDLLSTIGVDHCEVRLPSELDDVDALILPGGESTTMSNLLRSTELLGPLATFLASGRPVFGTCAGMILLSHRILDGRPDQIALDALDITVRRNGYGRQVDSFETDIDVDIDESTNAFHAVFIRAPVIESAGPEVVVLAEHDGHPVLVRQDAVLAAAFHPELTPDGRIHSYFADMVRDAKITPRNSKR
jgi:pyridoxal 5'-phosphate synthase pdxT subunit